MRIFITILLFLGLVCPAAFAQDWMKTNVKELQGDYGNIARNLQQTNDEATLIAILKQPGTENEMLYLKMLACKRLAVKGTIAAVPALAEMLADEKTAHYARFALEPIPGEEVDQALWDATKTLKGKLLIGVINSIAIRKNPKAEPVLIALVSGDDSPGHKDKDVARAVIASFGAIAGEGATSFFGGGMLGPQFEQGRKENGVAIADAAFHCAEVLLAKGNKDDAVKIFQTIQKMDGVKDFQKEAATYHEILALGEAGTDLLVQQIQSGNPKLFAVAMKAARELPGDDAVTKKLIDELGKTNAIDRKAALIEAIGDRTDDASKKLSLAPIAGFAKSNDPTIRLAAIKTLKKIGDSTVVSSLVDAATSTDATIAEAAQASLADVPGKSVDEAICGLLEKGKDKEKIVAINLVEQRRIHAAFPMLKTAAKSSNVEVSKAAIAALAEIVTLSDLRILVDVLAEAKSDAEIEVNAKALKAACSRMPREDVAAKVAEFLKDADDAGKISLLDVLMQIGGNNAVKCVSEYAWGDSVSLADKATELLGKWRESEDADAVAAVCLKLAKDAKDNKYKNRGLRGYIRYPRQFPMDENKRVEMVKQYLQLATRPADKELVFQAFTKYPTPKMLEEVTKLIDDESIREKACEAATAVADKIQGSSQATAAAMKKVLEATKVQTTKEKATRILGRQ